MNTERELQIDAHIKKCPDALLVNKEPVFIHGKLHELDRAKRMDAAVNQGHDKGKQRKIFREGGSCVV